MHIVYVSDGKAGHRAQALGLIHAMQQQQAMIQYQEIAIEDLSLWTLCWRWRHPFGDGLTAQPDLIIGVGSHTQLRVLLLARHFPQAKSLIIMKPNLPLCCFDYVVVPAHDGIAPSARVMTSLGALNPLQNQQRHQAQHLLIALGGPAKRYHWNTQKILSAITQIVACNPDARIKITTSRRTPDDILSALSALSDDHNRLTFFPVEETPPGWLAEQLHQAEATWVTEDSVSMLYEAMTAGCRVGVILMERIRADRITLALDQLLKSSVISADYRLEALPKPSELNESNRIAQLLLSRL